MKTRLDGFPRLRFAHLPTPLEDMPALTDLLGGPRLLVKRDDCTGLAFGGNKTRKLEFLMADARHRGADSVVTAGVVQSNHVRQTAAATARLGLACHVAVIDKVPGVDADYHDTGNIFLDRLLGAHLHPVPPGTPREEVIESVAADLRSRGGRPYTIPYGGSNPTGALGYVAFVEELLDQLDEAGLEPSALVHASGSGGTQGGILAGLAAHERDLPVMGIDIDAEPERVAADVERVLAGTLDLLGAVDDPPPVRVEAGYAGPGYGIPDAAMVGAVRTAARTEGLLLDPVYSGKAMAGLFDLVRTGRLGGPGPIIFLHTGGSPGLFAYRSAFPADPT